MHDVCSEETALGFIKDGYKPFFHPQWAWRSFAEGKLVEIILDCLAYDPADRLSVTDLVYRLRHAVWQNGQLGG